MTLLCSRDGGLRRRSRRRWRRSSIRMSSLRRVMQISRTRSSISPSSRALISYLMHSITLVHTPQTRLGARLLTVDARRHVNKMCLAADVPLIESGTTGFQGQVQPIVKVFWIFFFLWDCAYGRGNQNVTIAMRRKFRNRFLCVLFDRLHHSLSTA